MKKYIIGIILIVVVIGLVWYGTKQAAAPTPVAQTIDLPALDTTDTSDTTDSTPITNPKKFKINNMEITITQEGTGPAIANGQTAVVDYVGKLTDGTVFDASAPRGQDFEFPLGAGMVIQGWEKGVLGMKVGEHRTLVIPPEMGYGASGAGGVIPPNATLVFDVILKGIK